MFKKILNKVRVRSAYKSSVSQLSSMSDAQLRDIGIRRGDIRNISWQYAVRKYG